MKVKVQVVLGCSNNVASALNHMKRLTNLLKKEEVTQIHVTKRTGGTQLDIYHVPTFHVVSQRQIVSFSIKSSDLSLTKLLVGGGTSRIARV